MLDTSTGHGTQSWDHGIPDDWMKMRRSVDDAVKWHWRQFKDGQEQWITGWRPALTAAEIRNLESVILKVHMPCSLILALGSLHMLGLA